MLQKLRPPVRGGTGGPHFGPCLPRSSSSRRIGARWRDSRKDVLERDAELVGATVLSRAKGETLVSRPARAGRPRNATYAQAVQARLAIGGRRSVTGVPLTVENTVE